VQIGQWRACFVCAAHNEELGWRDSLCPPWGGAIAL